MAKENPSRQEITKQEIEELRYIQQVYQNQYAVATNSINMMLQEMQELNSAQKSLENIDLLKGREVLANMGADFYLTAKIQEPKSVLVAVGANYIVEKEIDSAKTTIADRIQKHNENLNKLMKNRRELEAALMDISYKLDNSI